MGQKIEIKYKVKVLTIVSIAETGLVLSNKGIESILDIEDLDQLVNLEKLCLNDNPYIALLAAVVIILGVTSVKYQQEKFPEVSTW